MNIRKIQELKQNICEFRERRAPIHVSVKIKTEKNHKHTHKTNTMAASRNQPSEFRYRFTIQNFIFIIFVSCILIGEWKHKTYITTIIPFKYGIISATYYKEYSMLRILLFTFLMFDAIFYFLMMDIFRSAKVKKSFHRKKRRNFMNENRFVFESMIEFAVLLCKNCALI